jgi:hypothetical protein
MAPRRILLALLATSPTSSSSWLGPSDSLPLFDLPELRSGGSRALAASGGRFYRSLSRSPVDGAFPEIHDSHAFEGFTSTGVYVNFSSASISGAATVDADHYGALLSLAEVACAREGGAGGSLLLRLSFAAPLSAEDAAAFAHLHERASLPGAHLVLGAATLRRHAAAFSGGCAPGGAAAAGFAPAPPVFSLRVEGAVPPHALALRLTPAPAAAAFPYLSFSLTVGGSGGGAPPPRARPLRRASALAAASPTFDLGVNFDAASGGAAAAKLQFFPAAPDSLFCDGCFFSLRGTLSASLQACAVVRRDAATFYYDASLAGEVYAGRLGFYGGEGGACAIGDGAGCKSGAAGGDAAARAATDCRAAAAGGLGTGLGATAPPALDVGVRAAAAVEGAATLRFALRSARGFAAAAAFPTSCAGDTAGCTRAPLPELPLPAAGPSITLTAGGLLIVVAPSVALEAAARADAAAPQLGLALGFAGEAPAARLGVSYELSSSSGGGGGGGGGAPSGAVAAAAFAPALCALPYALSGAPAGGVVVEATLSPRLRVSVGGVLAFSAFPAYTLRQAVGPAAAAAGGVVCAAARTAAAAAVAGSLGVSAEAAFLFPLARAFAGLSAVAGAADALVAPAATLVEPGATPLPAGGAVAAAVAATCTALGEPLAAAARCAAPAARGAFWAFVADNRAAVVGGSVAGGVALVALLAALGRAGKRRKAQAAAGAAAGGGGGGGGGDGGDGAGAAASPNAAGGGGGHLTPRAREKRPAGATPPLPGSFSRRSVANPLSSVAPAFTASAGARAEDETQLEAITRPAAGAGNSPGAIGAGALT